MIVGADNAPSVVANVPVLATGNVTVPLEVGDLIIAESDQPTSESDWTEVNKNIDIATTSTVGVVQPSSDNFAVSGTGLLTIKNGGVILGTETTGSYVSDLTGGTNVTVSAASGSVTINGLSNTAIGDIAEDITFTNKNVTAYDFATQTVNTSSDTSITVKAVIESQYRTNDDKPRLECNLMIDSANLDSKLIDNYDNIVMRDKTWKITKFEDNNYIINLTVGRES